MDPRTHSRFLEYRERFGYFGRSGQEILSGPDFAAAYAEMAALDVKPEGTTSDEEDARLAELRVLLFLD